MTMKHLLLALALLVGCQGREADQTDSSSFQQQLTGLNLAVAKPQVLVFGAGWCKPCLAEIDIVNAVSQKLAPEVIFTGMMVEGKQRGEVPTSTMLSELVSHSGARPKYRLLADAGWQLFDSVGASQGHALPLFVFVDANGTIKNILQRSPRDAAELEALGSALRDGTVPPAPKEEPKVEEPGRKTELRVVKTWAKEATPEIFDAFKASWQTGLGQFGFTAEQMPLNEGLLTLNKVNDKLVPVKGEWTSESGCTLTVWVKPDGTFASAFGVCS
jgi:thiol-disulfide isomerase/thioredoxin